MCAAGAGSRCQNSLLPNWPAPEQSRFHFPWLPCFRYQCSGIADCTTEVTESTEAKHGEAGGVNAEAAEGAEVTQMQLSCDSSGYSATSAFHFLLVSFLQHTTSAIILCALRG